MLSNARRPTLVLGAFLLAGVLSFLYMNPPKLASLYNLVPSSKGKALKYRDPTLGLWLPSQAHASDADAWNMYPSCNADLSGGPDGRDKEKEQLERRRHIAAWEWVLEDGNPPRPWDAEAFVERALKSRGGFVFVGDSVTDQMEASVRYFLGQNEGDPPRPVMEEAYFEDNGMFITVTHVVLHPENQLFAKLLAKPSLAAVPRSRFSRPIVSSYHSYDLINQKELNATLLMAGMEEPVNMHTHRADGDWRQGLKINSMEESWEGELDTIVVISTGPHWSPDHMSPASNRVLLKGYQLMLNKVYDFLVNPPLPIFTFFRSTAPGHQNCTAYSDPVAPMSMVATNPVPEQTSFGWHLFPEYNRMARELFGSSNHNNTRYFDIWPLSVQRPDAHTGWYPSILDCLHWCQPSVTQWWVKGLWHTIVEEGL